ncbi:MAG: ester cyclase [Lewinellaceae bacterium]|nr:ester cyclase [Saprospiraceae bacterium]MCB9329930.1 ester cyclase [Lewinellaceae bacterium]
MKTAYIFAGSLLCSALFLQCAASRQLRLADQNAETVRLWFEEGWNHNRNEELLERVFAPDWEDGNPLRPDQTTGIEGMREFVKYYQTAFSEAHFTITHLFATEKQVALRYEVSAKHIGPAFGVPATGKHFTSTGILIYDMENARIRRTWQELDLMGIMKQLKDDAN